MRYSCIAANQVNKVRAAGGLRYAIINTIFHRSIVDKTKTNKHGQGCRRPPVCDVGKAAGGLRYAIHNAMFHKSFLGQDGNGPVKNTPIYLEKHMLSSIHR